MFQNIHHSPSKNYSVGKIREKKLITPQQIRKKKQNSSKSIAAPPTGLWWSKIILVCLSNKIDLRHFDWMVSKSVNGHTVLFYMHI